MKHAFLILLASACIAANAQVLPIGSKTGLVECIGAYKVDTFFLIPVINTVTKTRSRLCDSNAVLVQDSATGTLKYMIHGTWYSVSSTHDSAAYYVPIYTKGIANGVATLDGTGHVPASQIPSTSATSVYVDSNVTAMLSHSNATIGAVSVRVDSSTTFILQAAYPTRYSSWVRFTYGGVSAYNGRAGAVIPRANDYKTDSIAEGYNNLYFTSGRVQSIVYTDTSTGVLATPHYVTSALTPTVKYTDSTSKYVTPLQLKDSLASRITVNDSITLSGDATGKGTVAIPVTLSNSGVTPNIYNRVTVDIKGRVTHGDSLAYLLSNQSITFAGEVTGYGSTSVLLTLDSQTHIVGSTNSPTIASGTGAGTTGLQLYLSNATDISGFVNLSAGASPAASATVATITFSNVYTGNVKVTLTPANAAAAALYGNAQVYVPYVSGGVSSFTIKSGSAALVATTNYIWTYTVSQ